MLDMNLIIELTAMISFTVAANIVLKLGAAAPESQRIFLGIFGWQSALGLCFFAAAGLIYAIVLRRLPLNIALAFTAAQYVGVAIAANVLLGEEISPVRWMGIACIGIGIFTVGLTSRA